MTQTVYIDILICVNLIINFFLLSVSFKASGVGVSTKRLLIGASVGALCSLVILLPEMPLPINIIIKLLAGAATVFASSGRRHKRLFIRLCAIFTAATLALCGAVFLICTLMLQNIFLMRNGAVYIAVSPILLIGATAFCYFTMLLIGKLIGRSCAQSQYCKIRFDYSGSERELFAKVDTGNSLTEPFSQDPVIVVNASALGKDMSIPALSEITNECESIRMVPFSSMGGSGVLPAFKAKNLKINKHDVTTGAYIALCDNKIKLAGVDALISSRLTEDILQ